MSEDLTAADWARAVAAAIAAAGVLGLVPLVASVAETSAVRFWIGGVSGAFLVGLAVLWAMMGDRTGRGVRLALVWRPLFGILAAYWLVVLGRSLLDGDPAWWAALGVPACAAGFALHHHDLPRLRAERRLLDQLVDRGARY